MEKSLMKHKKLLLALAPALVAGAVYATGTGAQFAAAVTWLRGELSGSLGTLITLAALAVGLGAGVLQQSLLAVVTGIAFALAVNYGPGILTGIVTASVGIQ